MVGSDAPVFLGAENLEPSPLLGHHACPIVLVVGLLLKEHVVDEESRSNKCGLATYVKVHGEPAKKKLKVNLVQKSPNSRDPKVIGVSEGLLEESSPLLGDPPHLVRLVRRHYLSLQKQNDGTLHRAAALNLHKEMQKKGSSSTSVSTTLNSTSPAQE